MEIVRIVSDMEVEVKIEEKLVILKQNFNQLQNEINTLILKYKIFWEAITRLERQMKIDGFICDSDNTDRYIDEVVYEAKEACNYCAELTDKFEEKLRDYLNEEYERVSHLQASGNYIGYWYDSSKLGKIDSIVGFERMLQMNYNEDEELENVIRETFGDSYKFDNEVGEIKPYSLDETESISSNCGVWTFETVNEFPEDVYYVSKKIYQNGQINWEITGLIRIVEKLFIK